MTPGEEPARRPPRTPLRQRSRKRWAIAGGIAAGWLVLAIFTSSVVSATVILMVIAVLGAVTVGGLRALGITRDHPWLQRMASRPWRDGHDVLKVAMRHMSEVFVVTPSGSLLAPNAVEVQLNPDDLATLCERMEPGVISSSLTEVYEEQVTAYGARFAHPGGADVYVSAADAVPPGRYRLRQGDPVGARRYPGIQYADQPPYADQPQYADQYAGAGSNPYADAAPDLAYAGSGALYAGTSTQAWYEPDPRPDPDLDLTVSTGGMVTMMEPSTPVVPLLRLVTGSSVAETRESGARAGRGFVELVLPEVPTVSREHALFTFADGRWWITNQGRNGLTVNGAPVAGQQPLSDGDAIRWGARPDALLSRVEIS